MESEIAKRSVIINGHKTSVSLEDAFWSEVKAIAAERNLSLRELVSLVDHERGEGSNLSSALRLFVLARYRPVRLPHRSGQRRGIESRKRRDTINNDAIRLEKPSRAQHQFELIGSRPRCRRVCRSSRPAIALLRFRARPTP